MVGPAVKKKTSFAMERQGVVGLLFTSPVLIILLLLLAYPFILGIWLSFTDTIIARTGRFIALENYFYLLSDDVFLLTTFTRCFTPSWRSSSNWFSVLPWPSFLTGILKEKAS